MNLHDRAFLSRYCTGWERFEPYLTGAADGQAKDADWAAAIGQAPRQEGQGREAPDEDRRPLSVPTSSAA